MIDELSNAIIVACNAHYGQKDKQDEPYIFHPLRVMARFTDEKDRIIAVLHDVIEDSELTIADLDDYGFSDAILDVVECLTKTSGEGYFDYLERVKQNPVALRIKLADIEDNVSRLDSLYKVDRSEARRLERKYSEARRFLMRK